MVSSMKRPVITLTALLIIGCLAPTAVTAAGPTGKRAPGPQATSTVVHDCAWATKQVRFAAVRVKKVRKRVRFGQLPISKYKQAIRIYHSYLRAKKELCAPGNNPPPPPPGPLPLTSGEVIAAITQIAKNECDIDSACSDYGAYSASSCDYITASQAACYGWNYEGFGDGSTCDFREIVSRSGYNGLTASRDTSYGNTSDGRFYCYF